MPGLASAGSGGASAASGAASSGSASATTPPDVQPGNVPVSATGDGITLESNASAFLRTGVSVTGTVPAGDAGAAVEIDQLAAGGAGFQSWTTAAVVRAQANGSFAASWRTAQPGPVTIRALLQGSQATSATSAPPAVSVTVYRRSIATLYGPGFWGHRTACGVILRRLTIGVANRTLPCGTEVRLYYHGSVMTVPVIDRGPYAHHANWDLTMATARALGMLGTEKIGAAALPYVASTAPIPPAAPPAGPPSAQ